MSIVSSLFERTLGNSSPLNSIVSDANFEEKLAFEVMNLSSQRTRFRMIDMHSKFAKEFSRTSLAINEYIIRMAEHLSDVFLSSANGYIDSVNFSRRIDSISSSDLSMAEVKANNFFTQAMGTKTAVVSIIDNKPEFKDMKKSISVLLEMPVKLISGERSTHFDYSWDTGFFNFKNKTNMIIILCIPKDYIRQTIFDVFIQNPKQQNDTYYDHMENIKQKVAEVIVSDIVLAFATAIYRETYRMEQTSDIVTIFELMSKEAPAILSKVRTPNVDDSTKRQIINSVVNEVYTRNFDLIKKHFDRSIMINGSILTDTINELSLATGKSINPINLYNVLFELGFREVSTVLEKIMGFSNLATGSEEKSRTIKLKDISSFAEDGRSMLLVLWHLSRFIPVALFAIYYADNGSKGAKFMRFMDQVSTMLSSARQIGSTYHVYRPVAQKLLNNIEIMLETYYKAAKDMQVVNMDSKLVIFNAIYQARSNDGDVIYI